MVGGNSHHELSSSFVSYQELSCLFLLCFFSCKQQHRGEEIQQCCFTSGILAFSCQFVRILVFQQVLATICFSIACFKSHHISHLTSCAHHRWDYQQARLTSHKLRSSPMGLRYRLLQGDYRRQATIFSANSRMQNTIVRVIQKNGRLLQFHWTHICFLAVMLDIHAKSQQSFIMTHAA